MGDFPRLANYKTYARVPPDRLISGFLTVNIRNSYDNSDAKDDTNEVYYTNWSSGMTLPTGSKESNPYGNTSPPEPNDLDASTHLAATDRTDTYQSFGDFDCFLFWVSGGMTLSSSLVYGTQHDDPSGYAQSGTWFESITDPRCSSYIRSQLIGRSNNAYGHGTNYLQMGTKTIKSLANSISDNLNNSASSYGEDGYHTEYVVNTSTYSDQHAAHNNKWSLDDVENNLFYSPVESIHITGSHRFAVTTNTKGGSPDLYALTHHDSTFYSIVLGINFFGYDTTESASVADKIRTDYNINVFFQPFGETPNLDFSTTEWSS